MAARFFMLAHMSILLAGQRPGCGVDDRLRRDCRTGGRINTLQALPIDDLARGVREGCVVLLVFVLGHAYGRHAPPCHGHGNAQVSDVGEAGAGIDPVSNAAQVEGFECPDVVNSCLCALLVPFENGILLLFATNSCMGHRQREYFAVVGNGLGVMAMLADHQDRAEDVALEQAEKGWTAVQLADRKLLEELRTNRAAWAVFADKHKRSAAREAFNQYAYQWF